MENLVDINVVIMRSDGQIVIARRIGHDFNPLLRICQGFHFLLEVGFLKDMNLSAVDSNSHMTFLGNGDSPGTLIWWERAQS